MLSIGSKFSRLLSGVFTKSSLTWIKAISDVYFFANDFWGREANHLPERHRDERDLDLDLL